MDPTLLLLLKYQDLAVNAIVGVGKLIQTLANGGTVSSEQLSDARDTSSRLQAEGDLLLKKAQDELANQ